MTKTLLLIFLGGGTGSLLRYAVQLMTDQHQRFSSPTLFPWPTFCVNLLGSFLIGLFYAWASRFNLSIETRLLLTTGLCGGFTTFSTFSYESMNLLRQGYYMIFIAYISASISLGIVATLAGGWVGKYKRKDML